MTINMNEDDPFPGSFRGGSFRGRGKGPGPVFEHTVCDEWIRLIKLLMEEKFIYQNVSLNSNVFTEIEDEQYPYKSLQVEFSKRPIYPLSDGKTEQVHASPDWMLSGAMAFNIDGEIEDQPLPFYLPALQLQCKECKGERTFGSLVDSRSGYLQAFIDRSKSPSLTKQVFTFYYLCNSCKNQTVVFQIVRNGLKLQLTGRSDPLRPNVGKWPKNINEIIENATQAVAENDVYGGFYHLRTALEHYIKSELKIDAKDRVNGEELGDRYKASLSQKVKTAVPSLSTIYTDLSECMHARTGDVAVFDKNFKKFENHLKIKVMISEIED